MPPKVVRSAGLDFVRPKPTSVLNDTAAWSALPPGFDIWNAPLLESEAPLTFKMDQKRKRQVEARARVEIIVDSDDEPWLEAAKKHRSSSDGWAFFKPTLDEMAARYDESYASSSCSSAEFVQRPIARPLANSPPNAWITTHSHRAAMGRVKKENQK